MRPQVLSLAVGLVLSAAVAVPAAAAPTPVDPTPTQAASTQTTPAAVPAAPVLEPLGDAPPPTQAGTRAVLAPIMGEAALGADPGAAALVADTGELLFQRGGNGPRTPASVAKIVTAALVLHHADGAQRLATRVVRGAAPGDLVLVGGGDPTLVSSPDVADAYPVPASLTALADQTAQVLAAEGLTTARLAVDDSLFTGPGVSPDWEDGYVSAGVVSPVSALTVDQGRLRPDTTERAPDPAVAAGRQLAELLSERGVAVTGAVRRGTAPPAPATGTAPPAPATGATSPAATAPASPGSSTDPSAGAQVPWPAGETVGEVESPTLDVIVEEMLRSSDNDLSEVLARLGAGAAGQPRSFDGVQVAAQQTLAELGLPTEGVRMLDGSGLARGSTLPPLTVSQLVAAATADERPELRPLVTGLPVAGFTGTLASRFTGAAAREGAGEVRAKTGTLTGVTALAGTAHDASGRLLVFAVMSDAVPVPLTLDARAAQDEFAAGLAACGCG